MSHHDLNHMTVSHPFRGNFTSDDMFSACKYSNMVNSMISTSYYLLNKVDLVTYLEISMNCRLTIDKSLHLGK